eukprot:290447-Chlamydomonas_euryale.AAC.1
MYSLGTGMVGKCWNWRCNELRSAEEHDCWLECFCCDWARRGAFVALRKGGGGGMRAELHAGRAPRPRVQGMRPACRGCMPLVRPPSGRPAASRIRPDQHCCRNLRGVRKILRAISLTAAATAMLPTSEVSTKNWCCVAASGERPRRRRRCRCCSTSSRSSSRSSGALSWHCLSDPAR